MVIGPAGALAQHAPTVLEAMKSDARRKELRRLGKESEWLVPGEGAVPLEAPFPDTPTAYPLPWVFRLVVADSAADTLTPGVEAAALHCTASAIQRDNRLLLYTAAHCLVLPQRKYPTRIWLTRKNMTPEIATFRLKREAISFASAPLRKWMDEGPSGDPIADSVDHRLRPSAAPSEWLQDLGTIALATSTWPKAWQTYPWSKAVPPRPTGTSLLLAGGGCTSAARANCAASVNYAMYVDTFLLSRDYGRIFSVAPADVGAATQVGDSGGPVLIDNQLAGVVSSTNDVVTFIERVD